MQTKKIAIMLLVHKNEEQVNRLIKHLAHDFAIYVHIDRRSSLKINPHENVFVYQKYKTYHGSFNQIIATLFLLEAAFKQGHERYLLISGQDLPIKTNAQIEQFFVNNNNEYVEFAKIPRIDGWPDMENMTNYFPNFSPKKMNFGQKVVWQLFYRFSLLRPRKLDYDFYGGANWTNYTHACVTKIFTYLQENPAYIKRYRWTNCADEIFYQTILAQIKEINIIDDQQRYVDWSAGGLNPKTLLLEDFDKIIKSDKLFARKFDVAVDAQVIEAMYERITK